MFNQNRGYEEVGQNDNNAGPPPGSQQYNWFNRSWRICRLFGIDIRIHYMLPIFLIFTIVIWIPIIFNDTGNWYWYILLIIAFNAAIWESVFIHELGHTLFGYCIGGHTDRIILWPLGGLAHTHPPPQYNNAMGDLQRRKDHIIIALGGPVTQFSFYTI